MNAFIIVIISEKTSVFFSSVVSLPYASHTKQNLCTILFEACLIACVNRNKLMNSWKCALLYWNLAAQVSNWRLETRDMCCCLLHNVR